MNKQLYKLIICSVLLPFLLLGSNGDNDFTGKYTKEKTITKEFSVNSDALLKVSSSYGNIQLTSWDKNTVAIEVTIKTNGNSESKVAERLSQIDVDFENSASMVSAKTNFNTGSKKWWKWNNNSKIRMTVHYTIKFPKGNELNISNDYGAIFLDRAENRATLSCDYGTMEIGELLADHNTLNFDYSTSTVTVASMKSGKINADYSSFMIHTAEDIRLNADYTKSRFGTVRNIEYNCDYNNLQIDKANHVNGTGDYLSLRLGTITGNVEIVADYGSIKIAEMTKDAGNIRIESEYAGIKIGYQPQYYFNFELILEYASIKGEEDFSFNKKRVEDGERYYVGHYGSSKSNNNITIDSEYGSVRFEKL
ncbi:hypothetical protein [Kordia zhangzhouensis]|uniref:hypothetical protein n=1 Tax=Kordia zhangzhouensis TaxID=1620405 RepID=UPI000629981B|nr:hypothetical protein [Kordia zhangzhouensis]